jgi:CRP-like cAMP-binding protein
MGDAIYILVDGGVTVTRFNRLLNTLSAGNCFGEMAYIGRRQMPRSATVAANTEITVIKIAPDQLAQLSDRCQLHLNQAFLFTLADRLRIADDRVARLANQHQ